MGNVTSKYYSYAVHCCNVKFSRPAALVSPYLDWHTPKGLKVRAKPPNPPSLCMHRTHVTGVVCKVVHTKRILVHFCVLVGTVCKSSAHCKLTSFCSILMMHKFKPAEFHATCCWDKLLSLQQNVFAKMGVSHKEN